MEGRPMGRRTLASCLFALLLIAGCRPGATNTSTGVYADGRYTIEVEGNHSINSHTTDDGAGNVEELVELTCGATAMKIVNGKLTVNGADRGTLQPKDRIRVTSDGKVYVNGVER
jgi:hypothetical protein